MEGTSIPIKQFFKYFNFQVGTEIEANLKMQETVGTVAYQVLNCFNQCCGAGYCRIRSFRDPEGLNK